MNFEEIRNTAYSYMNCRILLTALELDVFSILNNSQKTSEEITKILDSNLKATDRLLNALVAIGLLRKEENYFQNTKTTQKFLSKNSPEYFGMFMHISNLWHSWGDLTNIVKTGEKPLTKNPINQSNKWLEDFIDAMHHRAKNNAEQTISQIDFSNVKNILDVGGGSGVYSMAMVKQGENINSTVFDLPEVIKISEKYISEANLNDKITTKAGDLRTDDFGGNYDLIFISAIIHMLSPDENQELINKCSACLNKGGQIVICDFIMEENRISPNFGAVFAINMLTGTENGDTYTESEIKTWLEKANFENIKRLNPLPNLGQIIGINC